jgi:hypothetical protein
MGEAQMQRNHPLNEPKLFAKEVEGRYADRKNFRAVQLEKRSYNQQVIPIAAK